MSPSRIEPAPAAANLAAAVREGVLATKFAGVSLIGFAIDACLLHVGIAAGVAPAWARVISLFCAMQATFVINGLHVFRTLDRRRLPHQWARYMVANGFGNFCNYWIFVTLVSLHWPVVSSPLVALAAGSFAAWMINFTCTRFFVFGKAKGALETFRRRRTGLRRPIRVRNEHP
jgi:putative flippase GtrA